MIEDEKYATDDMKPPTANDNGDGKVSARVDAVVLRIARLIGRQMGGAVLIAPASCYQRD